MLTARERVLACLNHREPDQVPFDLGGTTATGIHAEAYCALLRHLGVAEAPARILDPIQGLAAVDLDVLERLEVDVEPVLPADPSRWTLDIRHGEGQSYSFDEFRLRWSKPDDGLYYDVSDGPSVERSEDGIRGEALSVWEHRVDT